MRPETRPKTVFIGTPEFGAIILEGLCKANFKPSLVVTAPDKPVGRKQIKTGELTPPPVKIMAQRYNISTLQSEKILDIKSKIKDTNPDLVIVAAYGQILPKEILEIPKYGCLNVHPSLLPKYRGASPIQYAILNGEKETGVTIILMDAQMDHGPILTQRKTEIDKNETYKLLQDRLALMGAKLLIETIPKWLRGEIKLKRQNEKQAIYTKVLKKEDGKVDWKKSAEEIERQIRAFEIWPGSFTFWEREIIKFKNLKKRVKKKKKLQVKVLKSRVLKVLKSVNLQTYPIGKTLVAPQNELCVQCGKDFLIIERLQMEGKKPMGSEAFLNGHPDFIGTILK